MKKILCSVKDKTFNLKLVDKVQTDFFVSAEIPVTNKNEGKHIADIISKFFEGSSAVSCLKNQVLIKGKISHKNLLEFIQTFGWMQCSNCNNTTFIIYKKREVCVNTKFFNEDSEDLCAVNVSFDKVYYEGHCKECGHPISEEHLKMFNKLYKGEQDERLN